jgi:signal transduction histidine kinase/CheY-like chemotaxis protein
VNDPDDVAALEHRLGIACALVHALVDVAAIAAKTPTDEGRRRHAEALRLVEETELPAAVFDRASQLPRLTNAAWRALFPAGGVPELATRIEALLAEPTAATDEHVGELELATNGQIGYVAATLRPLRDGGGNSHGVIVVCAMITDDVLARELDVEVSAGALIWSAPLTGDADFFNEAWREYVGSVTGPWQAAIEPDDLARCAAALAEAARARVSTDVLVRVRRADGEARWHRVRFSSSRPRRRWFGIAVDIHDSRNVAAERTELLARERAARADAEQANRLKDQFIAAVSHELRAPLTTMLLWEKVLTDVSADDALRARALSAIHDSALAQSHLVGDLLDVSRAISGKLYVDLRPVDLGTIVEGALASIAVVATDKGVTVVRQGERLLGEVLGDSARLRQILDNLLSNAVKFTDPGGLVTVKVTGKSRAFAIEVTDTGRGIPPDFLPRLFEPFSQTDDALTRRAGGLGLGLAIARQLVELHHGTLTAVSAGLGKGASFTVSLPITTRRIPSPPLGVPRQAELDGVAVLVVDDERRVRDALALLLRRAGAAVETADSADSARTRIAARRPEVILCDIAMPGVDGYQFIAELRREKLDVPAIAVTAHVSESDSRRALTAGFDLHVAKPIDFERLVGAIAGLITARRPA